MCFVRIGRGRSSKKNKTADSSAVGQTLLGFGEAEATEPVSHSFSWIDQKKPIKKHRVPGFFGKRFGLDKERGVGMAMTLIVSFRRGVHPSPRFTWTQTRQCAAWCCPGGSGAGFCTCHVPPSRSRRAACRSASSWYRLGLRPTPSSESERGDETTKKLILSISSSFKASSSGFG